MTERPSFWKRAAKGAGKTVDAIRDIGANVAEKTSEHLDKPSGMTRREVLVAGATAGAVGVAGGIVLDTVLREGKEEAETGAESFEDIGAHFMKEVEKYRRTYQDLTAKEIQLYDSHDTPLPTTTPIKEFNGISPGQLTPEGIVIGTLNQEWLDAVRADICARYPELSLDPTKDLRHITNFSQIIRGANERNPDMNAETMADVARYNGQKEVKGVDGHIQRIEYARKHSTDFMHVSSTVAEEISGLVPALAAQESQYDNTSDSGVARGILQFRDAEWKSLGYREEDRPFFTKQVEAASKLLQGKLTYLQDHLSEELTYIQNEYFTSLAEYEKYFLAPVLINTYNSGEGNLTKVIKWFIRTYPHKLALGVEITQTGSSYGYDVYGAMARLARQNNAVHSYGDDSSQYVARILAWKKILQTW